MSKLTIGIDLGTTYSLAALVRDGTPIAIPNGLGELLTPSVVSVDQDGTILVGAPAKERLTTHPERTASVFKRTMGSNHVYRLGQRSFRSEELSAFVLRTLREDVERYLGQQVDEAVVTVPAYFGELQRRATHDACAIAGLHVERIVNEPTAAALAFGLHALDRELKAIVLDLGGGTFDVTALEILEGIIEIQSSAGDVRLGGEDFTRALGKWIEEQLIATHGCGPAEGQGRARVTRAAEGLKRHLSSVATATAAISSLELADGRSVDWEGSLTRVEAERRWDLLLRRLQDPIFRALGDAGWKVTDIDEVLLVGGATRMPCLLDLAARLFGKVPQRHLPPDEAVALGAAVQAALKEGNEAVQDLVVTDVAPFTLGVEICEDLGTRRVNGIFRPILERGTVLPASRVERVSTANPNQTSMELAVYQGESAQCSKNQKLGEFLIRDIPRGPAGAESLDVRFTYDLNGVLEVEATVLSTGKTSTLVIDRSPNRLSRQQLEEAQRQMARLKFHPRDALPNTTALSRADALYIELQGESRAILSQAITTFRLALETQDPATIEGARGELLRLCSSLRPTRGDGA